LLGGIVTLLLSFSDTQINYACNTEDEGYGK